MKYGFIHTVYLHAFNPNNYYTARYPWCAWSNIPYYKTLYALNSAFVVVRTLNL